MNSTQFSPHDIVLTSDNVICTVQRSLDNTSLLVHPKYLRRCASTTNQNGKQLTWNIFGEEWIRVSNPLDCHRHSLWKFSQCLSPYDSKDYFLDIKNISLHFSVFLGTKNLLSESNIEDEHREKVQILVNQLVQYIPIDDIGIAGSTLLNSQILGVSDIDLVIKNSDNYTPLKDAILNSKVDGIRLRDQNEWVKFYNDYGVQCSLSPVSFAKHMVKKPQQFTFENISVSVFFVDPNQLMPTSIPSELPNLKMDFQIIDDTRSMFIPAEYKVMADGKKFTVYCENRAFISQANQGDWVRICGFLKEDIIYVRENNEDFIECRDNE
jgi:predicted nucleotidyltransferase